MEQQINSWTRKSKKFKARTFEELGRLYRMQHDKDIIDDPIRGSGTDQTSHLADQTRN